jgi:hypothetical protein
VAVSIFGLMILELFRFGWKYLPFNQPQLIFPLTPVIEFIKKQPGIFRVDGGGAIPVNMWLPYGLESLAAYDAVYPLRTAEYIAAVNSGSIEKPQGRHGTILRYDSRLLDMANVCYLLAVKTDTENFQLKKLAPVFEDKRVVVLKNNDCLPRAWMVGNYEIKSGQEIINRLIDPNFDPRSSVILESEPKIAIVKNGGGLNEKITWERYEANRQELLVEADSDGFLVITDSYYPGWKAYIDEEPAEIYRANFNFRTIYLPAGNHRVRFNYEPVWVKIGGGISLTGLAIFAILLVHECFRKHRPPRARAAGVL